ncbi:MAG: bifunctional folylpolyglutamate synthase/dihydrofolate synthase [Actinomycetota bacterium]
MTSRADVEAALAERTNFEKTGQLRTPTLERMTFLADVLGSPQEAFGVIAITGTNGKSTAALAASAVLSAAGLTVGTYTSPHVSRITERIRYDLDPIDDDAFVEAWRELGPILEFCDSQVGQISWFEAMTGLGLLIFADRGVDVAVMEVGMGGSWDATNIADAQVALALPVGHDHAVLGATPAEKAVEKAGIIKEGSSLVLSSQPEEGVREVFLSRAAELDVPVIEEGDSWGLEEAKLALAGQSLSLTIGGERYDEIFLPMFGTHVAHSAVAGLTAGATFLAGEETLDEDLISEAAGRVRLPGRMEVLRRKPLVLVDGAHNEEATHALATALPVTFRYDQLRLVVGAMADKDLPKLLRPLALLADEIICTRVDWPRAADPEMLAEVIRAQGISEVRVVGSPRDAIGIALEHSRESDAVLIAGSLYLAGDAREVLAGGD